MSSTDIFLERNAAYAAAFSSGELSALPARGIAVVTCMDARIDVGRMLGLEPGDAHVIRNAGGVVTQDVVRSLVVSQALLGTREVMVIQHTDCGMSSRPEEELKDAVEEAAGDRPPFDLHGFSNLKESVRASVAKLRASPLLVHVDSIRGFVYHVASGTIEEVPSRA